MGDYLVMTGASEGSIWQPDSLFHNLRDARDRLAYLSKRNAQRYVTIVPVVLDWDHQIDAYLPQQETIA